MSRLWGIDLGGTKIEAAVLKSADEPEVLIRKRVSTEREQGYQHILQRIKSLLDDVGKELGEKPNRIGIGTPGSLDPQTQTLKNSNTVVLNEKPFHKDLEAALGVPVEIANDANCFALAEARMGIVQDVLPAARVVFGVILGTGVGGGVVIDGKVWNGRQGIGGEWGHSYLDASGGECYCGDVGCTEMIISGPALERFYHGQGGEKKKLREIFKLHQHNVDPVATKTIERLLHFFGKGLSNVINILDPEVIVLGGGVGNIDLLYSQGVEEVKKHIFNTRFETLITKPKLGDSAGVFGAAYLVA